MTKGSARRLLRASSWPRPVRRGSSVTEEQVDISGELGVMLEQETVGRVRVNLEPRVRDEAGKQVRVTR